MLLTNTLLLLLLIYKSCSEPFSYPAKTKTFLLLMAQTVSTGGLGACLVVIGLTKEEEQVGQIGLHLASELVS